MTKPKDIDAYVSRFPNKTQTLLERLRATIKKAAPLAKERISYGIPAFELHGMLVWFAAYARHIGFYPRASGIRAFKKKLAMYKSAKGSVQFPLDKPLPIGLITNIVKFRVVENLKSTNRK
jgi:uncharacterized protein YdhG (YjbR/CyaY superfamily)